MAARPNVWVVYALLQFLILNTVCGLDTASTSTLNTTSGNLPRECLKPTGADCSWYLDCLEKRYPCKKTQGHSYAVDFAEHFCNLFQQNRHRFTTKGQAWIDAARKCLQVALAPLLLPNVSVTCDQIQQDAFATHAPCYLHPSIDAPSICDLDPVDWLRVFWTIKESFIDVPEEALLGVWDVTKGCAPIVIKRLWKWIKHIIFHVEFVKSPAIEKRSADFDHKTVAKQIVADVAGNMQWKEKGISWFGYVGEANATSANVHILLTDRKSHDVNAPSSIPSADVNDTVHALSDAANGTFSFNTGSNIKVKKLYGCEDLNCTIITFEEIVVEAKVNGEAMVTYAIWVTILVPSLVMTIFI